MRDNIVLFIYMVVLIIFLLSLFLIADYLFRGADWWPFHHERVPLVVTGQTLHCLQMDLFIYKEETGMYPHDIEELRDWLGIPEKSPKWKTRILDAWGRPIKYVLENPKLNKGKFDLYSLGENGRDDYNKPDFGDDIHVFENTIRYPTKK